MRLAALVDAVRHIRATTKKTEKVRLLAELLRQTHERNIELLALYLSGLMPQGKIGVGWSVIQKAMVEGAGIGAPLMLFDVDRTFAAVAADQGPGSTDRKVAELRRLFGRASTEERQFLAQLIVGEIRQGALEGLVLEAIAEASALSSADVRQAFMFAGHVGDVARAALEEGAGGLARFSLQLFTPVSPMLANSAETVDEALERLETSVWEYKLDGVRIQIHKGGQDVRIFTRQLQEITQRVPEISEWVRNLPVRDAILDGEAIALRADGRPQPFQVTMRRLGRIKDVETLRRDIPLSPFMFDALYAEGQALIGKSYEERTKILDGIVPAGGIVPRLVTKDSKEAQRFLEASLTAGHEGLMAKSLVAPYMAGQCGFHWLKLKAAATLDLVILAAEWGNGRRQGWLSNLHLGARDPESGRFVMLGKTFKGLTDDMLKWQTDKLLSLETHRDPMAVYVRPELVVEIAFGDVQESPRYPAGLALRFARVKRYRPDKTVEEADTIQTVAAQFRRQRA